MDLGARGWEDDGATPGAVTAKGHGPIVVQRGFRLKKVMSLEILGCISRITQTPIIRIPKLSYDFFFIMGSY